MSPHSKVLKWFFPFSFPRKHLCLKSWAKRTLLTSLGSFPFIKILEWHWLIRLYTFQVYTSMTHDLHIALCAHHPKSNHLPSPYIWPLYLLLLPTSLSSGNYHAVVCVYEFVFVFLVCCFQFYRPHMSKIIWLTFFVWLISLSMIFSRPTRVVANRHEAPFLV